MYTFFNEGRGQVYNIYSYRVHWSSEKLRTSDLNISGHTGWGSSSVGKNISLMKTLGHM